MIRVGVLCDHLEIGGQELGCLEVVRRLDRKRFDPRVYAFRPGALVENFRALGVPVAVAHDKPGIDPSWTARDEAALRDYRTALVRVLRADAIEVALVYAWRDGIPAATEAGVAAIVERVDGLGLESRIRDKSACRRIICESKAVRAVLLAQREILRCDPKRITVVPNGVDRRLFDPRRFDRELSRRRLGLAPDDFALGAVARLAPQKNLEYLLDAAAGLVAKLGPERGPRVRVLLAGPDRGAGADLERRARQLGLGDRVTLLGPRRDVPEVLRALDVFVLASIAEGAPFALLEAMAMALPVVATPVGAVADIIDGNGYLVSVLHPEEATQALGELFHDPALRARFARRSRALARRYDVERMVRNYEAVLVEALEEARAEGERAVP